MRRGLTGCTGRWLFTVIVAAGAGTPMAGFAASQIFVEIPEIGACGSATELSFVGAIQARSFTEFLRRVPSQRTGLLTNAIERELTLLKDTDGCSPLLFLAALTGQTLTVHAYFVQVGPVPAVPAEIIATDAFVSFMNTDFNDFGSAPLEGVRFGVAGTLTVLTRRQNANGSLEPPVSRCWSFVTNAAC